MRLPKSVFLFCVAYPLFLVLAEAQTFKFQSVGFVAPAAINSSGAIAGTFCCSYIAGPDGPEQATHGFTLKGMVFKVAEPQTSLDSFATGIAPNGDVVGGFCPVSSGGCASVNAMHGYAFAHSNSAVQIDVPGAFATLAGGINNSGQIVGMSSDATTCSLAYPAEAHGFLLNHIGGSFTTIDYPGALGDGSHGNQ